MFIAAAFVSLLVPAAMIVSLRVPGTGRRDLPAMERPATKCERRTASRITRFPRRGDGTTLR